MVQGHDAATWKSDKITSKTHTQHVQQEQNHVQHKNTHKGM